MKTVNVNVNLYSFSELSAKAKKKAIEDHRSFELSIMQPNDFITGIAEYDTPEELQKTYEAQYNYYAMNDEPIIENIEANNYLFFANGKLASCVTYCGNSDKAGITEFKFMGKIYNI
jgi:mRNA-degrading endonuclease HigB of HigAB toxin-antitoxin module